MGLAEVKKEILDKADSEADAIIKQAETQAKKVEEDAIAQSQEYDRKSDKNTEKLLETLERREIASASFDAKKMQLDMKKELVLDAIREAKEELANKSGSERANMIKSLIEKAKKEIDVKIIYANKKDKQAVESSGFKYVEKDMLGGIIAETEDGKISVNYSFEEILDDIAEKSITDIEKELF